MKTRNRIEISSFVAVVCALTIACERPPVDTTQIGYRGLGLENVQNPRIAEATLAANQVPTPVPPVPAGGELSSTAFKNVQVLGDLTTNEFSRLMVAMTAWVSPEQGCTYCHAGPLDSDAIYTKVVARRMIQMVREINTNWQPHVKETGVTCYTCHRGQPVPAYVWSTDPGPAHAFNAGNKAGQNTPAHSVGLTSLPYDPFTPFLLEDNDIRVQSKTALPEGNRRSIKETEWTYGLMMHVSDSLGVNCGHCHNTRSFMPWEASSPARVNAWHAIRMARLVNTDYITPLTDVLPANRKGPLGDPFKVNCATCHQGLPKPLQGVSMLKDYPELMKGTSVPSTPTPFHPDGS